MSEPTDLGPIYQEHGERPWKQPRPFLAPVVERVIGERETIDLPPEAAPFAKMVLGPMVASERCQCPWWHRLPFVGRFVHSELP